MDINQSTSLVVKEHDFQEAKNSLKKYTEQAKENVALNSVPCSGGLFNLRDHKVTGVELNRITSQIEDYMIGLYRLSNSLVDEFGQVYKAFESLDRDYIAAILASIKSAEKVSKDEQKDRKDIKELIEQHKQSIAVLKKFKKDIEQIKHLADVDKVWDRIERQSTLLEGIENYIVTLSQNIQELSSSLERQNADIDNLKADISSITSALQDSTSDLKQKILEFSNYYNDEVKALAENQALTLKRIEDNQAESINTFFFEQQAKLSSIEAEQVQTLNVLSKRQAVSLGNIEKTQKEAIEHLSKSQSEVLAQISKDQSTNWEHAIKTLEEEKIIRDKEIAIIVRKAKYAYYIAGSAVALALIQLILNILGII